MSRRLPGADPQGVAVQGGDAEADARTVHGLAAHVVDFYDRDEDLIASLVDYVAAGFDAGDAVVVLATAPHRAALETASAGAGIDLRTARASGAFTMVDAADTLAGFMVDGIPQMDPFASVVGDLIRQAAADGRPVRAFGEMVALLWDEGNVAAAIDLEALWDQLATGCQLSLYCAYKMSSLAAHGDLGSTNEVCQRHSTVIAPVSYGSPLPSEPSLADLDERSQLFVPVPSAIRAVRWFVTETLFAWGEAELVNVARIVVSELATNAVRHADSAFRAEISRSESQVTISIHDASRLLPKRRRAASGASGGRGVSLVADLSAEWGAELAPAGKVVWSQLNRSANGRSTQLLKN